RPSNRRLSARRYSSARWAALQNSAAQVRWSCRHTTSPPGPEPSVNASSARTNTTRTGSKRREPGLPDSPGARVHARIWTSISNTRDSPAASVAPPSVDNGKHCLATDVAAEVLTHDDPAAFLKQPSVARHVRRDDDVATAPQGMPTWQRLRVDDIEGGPGKQPACQRLVERFGVHHRTARHVY